MFETPVLLIIFNRPDATRQTLDAIRHVRPRQLFVAADGPRPNKPTDAERCRAARVVIEEIDWPCTVQTLFRSENRGCGRGPAEAISWFFGQVEEGIILEDDCVPDPSFFLYCQTLLEKYRHDEQVFMISGTNALKTWPVRKESYLFSYMGHSLGWASWRRAWAAFDYDMAGWASGLNQQKIRELLKRPLYYDHFCAEFDKYHTTRPNDVWDFQWLFARWINGGKTIVPTVNLITNIGFNADATHSVYETDPLANLPLHQMGFPLKHPADEVDQFFDWYLFERFISLRKRPLWKKIVLKTIRMTLQSSN